MPRTVRSRRILGGPLRGLRITTSWHDYPAAILGRTERPLLNWFQANVSAGETWLDVGAHYGYTAMALSRLVGPDGRIFAFEPMIRTAGCVMQTRESNNLAQLTVLPLALGASAHLQLERLPSVRGMVDSTVSNETWREAILVAGLDWLWPQISGTERRIDGIKIDVQGMEIQALRGMASLLMELKPKLVVEVHQNVPRSELLRLLRDIGYSSPAVPIEPIAGEKEPLYIDDRSYAFMPAQACAS